MDKIRQSRRYSQFVSEELSLERQFLARAAKAGRATDAYLKEIAAFRLLLCAELESYLEDQASRLLHNCLRQAEKGKYGRVAASVLAFTDVASSVPEKAILQPKGKSEADRWEERMVLESRLRRLINVLFTKISASHGCSEKFILALLVPVGCGPDDFDHAWLAEVNQLWDDRGMVAHKAFQSYRFTYMPDPKLEAARAKRIVAGLAPLDRTLLSLV